MSSDSMMIWVFATVGGLGLLIGLIVMCVLAVFGALFFLVFRFSDDQENIRAITSHPRVRIGDVKAGDLVRIAGRICAMETPLIAPLSGRRCVHYEAVVDEHRSAAKSSRWVERIREVKSLPSFEISDESGTAVVETRSLQASVLVDVHHTSGALNEALPHLKAFLARHGETDESRRLRYNEGALALGELVVVVGRVRFDDDPDQRVRCVVLEAGEGPVRVTNDPKSWRG